MSVESKDDDDINLDVTNFLLMKNVYDNDDGLFLVGTLIQRVFDEGNELNAFDENKELKDEGDKCEKYFPYRINEKNAYYVKRRTTTGLDSSLKTTFELNAKLDKTVKFDSFPFKIITATATIELQSIKKSKNTLLRPNLLVNKMGKCMNMIQHIGNLKYATDKMDQSLNYDFITPLPTVRYKYNHEKEYCSKLEVTFYMLESSSHSKFVQIIFPMLLITILNTINVSRVDESDFVSNASTFALTAVFILPSIIGEAKTQNIINSNNIYIMFIFIGLAFSSISEEWAGTRVFKHIGMILLWASFIIPIGGFFGFYYTRRKILRNAPKENERLDEKCEKKADKEKKTGSRSSLIPVIELAVNDKDNVPLEVDVDVETGFRDNSHNSLIYHKVSESERLTTVYG